MWSPTHCNVTVQRARGLLTKGKNGTNNCFVTIALGKEKYQTSVKDKTESNVSWNEECELKIPDQGNRAELTLTCLHRNNLGIDEFLGQVTLPLKDMDVYDRPRAKWFKLESKPGKEKKNKERGELEVRIAFVVKSGSLTDLSKKDKQKSSLGQLASSVGGSLLSIGQGEKRKSFKKLAGSFSSKLHIRSNRKPVDGDESGSICGSVASIGTPNSASGLVVIGGGSGRQRGQRAGEADPGVISEDEDEFVFDNLSHKSSGSSLNLQRSGLQMPVSSSTTNFAPSNPSPLLSNGNEVSKGKINGGKAQLQKTLDKDPILADMEQLELDFCVRARTLPPPSKPSRTTQEADIERDCKREEVQIDTVPPRPVTDPEPPVKLDEWESKLYCGGKYLEIDSLKHRSWDTRVPLAATNEKPPSPTSKSSTSSSHSEHGENKVEQASKSTLPRLSPTEKSSYFFSPKMEAHNFHSFNARFAEFEQRYSNTIVTDEQPLNMPVIILKTEPTLFSGESNSVLSVRPTPQPRVTNNQKQTVESVALDNETTAEKEAVRQRRAEGDELLDSERRLNEQRLLKEKTNLSQELGKQEVQRRRDAKRREEDQRLLSFAKRSTSLEEQLHRERQTQTTTKEFVGDIGPSLDHFLTPEQSPKQFSNHDNRIGDCREKGLGKFKYGYKRDKQNFTDSKSIPRPQSTERIIIGHEKSCSHAERSSQTSEQLEKKYEGKSRQELMLIANGMENEALLMRQRVKELEDYLDNLLLRVMETHPKILQNPYSRTTSAKSYKNYINMNDFLK